eukprot:Nk52_evm35s233 gene=Nk52_evmTU35s233
MFGSSNRSEQIAAKEARLYKKADVFFREEKENFKRLKSLYSFLASANEPEQKCFFADHYYQVYSVILDAFLQVEAGIKHKAIKEKEATETQKQDLFDIMSVLEKLLLYLPELVQKRWQIRSLGQVFLKLLNPENQQKVRLEGMRMLLIWLEDLQEEATSKVLGVFANCINLDPFANSFKKGIDLCQPEGSAAAKLGGVRPGPAGTSCSSNLHGQNSFVSGGSGVGEDIPLVPVLDGDTISPIECSVEMLKYFLECITVRIGTSLPRRPSKQGQVPPIMVEHSSTSNIGGDKEGQGGAGMSGELFTAQLKLPAELLPFNYLFTLFKTYYLTLMYPEVCRRIGLLPQEPAVGFPVCPKQIQSVMVPWMVNCCVGNASVYEGIREVLYSSVENIAIVQEVFRQTFLLPFSYNLFMQLTIRVYQHWIHKKPVFMEECAEVDAEGNPVAARDEKDNSVHIVKGESIKLGAQKSLRIFIHHCAQAFYSDAITQSSTQLIDMQTKVCKEVLSLYHIIILEKQVKLTMNTWEFLLNTLLDITTLCRDNSLPSRLEEPLLETLFNAWIRANMVSTLSAEMWKRLLDVLMSIRHCPQVIHQYSDTMLSLTYILALHVYEIDTENLPLDQVRGRSNLKRRLMQQHQDTVQASRLGEMESEEKTSSTLSSPVKVNAEDATLSVISPPQSPGAFLERERLSDITGDFKKYAEVAYQEFVSIKTLDWTPGKAMYQWRNFLSILGNINEIEDPGIFAETIASLDATWTTLETVRCNQGISLDNLQTPPVPEHLPPLFEFSTWIFEACAAGDKFHKGRAVAYGLLCRMILRGHPLLPAGYLPAFYQLLHKGLTGDDFEVVKAIITNATGFFAKVFPGSTVLLMDFISAIENVLMKKKVSKTLRLDSLSILGSMCSITYLHGDNSIPVIDNPKESYTFASVRLRLLKLLREGCFLGGCVDTQNCVVNCLTAHIYMDLSHGVCDSEIDLCVSTLLALINSESISVSMLAIDSVRLLALQSSTLLANTEVLVNSIVKGLTFTITNLLSASDDDPKEKETKVVGMFFCLLEWLMVLPLDMLNGGELAEDIFSAIECGMDIEGGGKKGTAKTQNTTTTSNTVSPKPSNEKDSVKFVDAIGNKFENFEFNIRSTLSRSKRKGDNASAVDLKAPPTAAPFADQFNGKATSYAALTVLFTLINNFGNYPSFAGVCRLTSRVSEHEDITDFSDLIPAIFNKEQVQFFVYNDYTLISMVEIPRRNGQGTQSRVILRDFTGKYAWDMDVLYGVEDKPMGQQQPGLQSKIEFLSADVISEQAKANNPKEPYVRKYKEVPEFSPSDNCENIDMINELLCYVGETSIECIKFDDVPLNVPYTAPKFLQEHEDLWVKKLTQQKENEQRYLDSSKENPQPTMISTPCIPEEAPKPQSPFHQCRVFLSQMGFLSWENRKHFHLLRKNDNLIRRLKQLDKTESRDYHKIGVVYVSRGQEDECSILGNTRGSRFYEDFLAGIGWEVDLNTHSGFMGGLDSKSTGSTTCYYATSTMQVIFHVTTRMPSSVDDEKQLKKKRHIGNDRVQIVWTEHTRVYRPEIIKTRFNDAIIVISPLPNTLYKIQVVKKPEVPVFGPLFDGMVVDKKSLAPLVRETAINANRAVMSLVEGYKRYYEQRQTYMDEIVTNHKSSSTFEDFVASIFQPVIADTTAPLIEETEVAVDSNANSISGNGFHAGSGMSGGTNGLEMSINGKSNLLDSSLGNDSAGKPACAGSEGSLQSNTMTLGGANPATMGRGMEGPAAPHMGREDSTEKSYFAKIEEGSQSASSITE